MIRRVLLVTELIFTIALSPLEPQQQSAPLPGQIQGMASFDTYQPTGIAVSKTGRIFVNFPLWSDDYKYGVVEVMPDSSTTPYPSEIWNSWKTAEESARGSTESQPVSPSKSFVCVQSVWVDDRDRLWILDAASPRMEGVVPGGPKLVCVDLKTNEVAKIIAFNDEIAPPKSYLNDVRIDTKRDFAYLTESGLGAIIAVNLKTDQARRLLADHPSTKAEADVKLVVQGVELKDSKTGKTPQIHADGIALSADGEHLYYHALTGKTLYRIPTSMLRDESASESAGERVENLGQTVVTDGMLIDKSGNVYHTALESDSIVRFTPDKSLQTLVKDPQIAWPDSMAFGPDDSLYFTTSQIHRMPRFNQGQSTRTEPYRIFRTTTSLGAH